MWLERDSCCSHLFPQSRTPFKNFSEVPSDLECFFFHRINQVMAQVKKLRRKCRWEE